MLWIWNQYVVLCDQWIGALSCLNFQLEPAISLKQWSKVPDKRFWYLAALSQVLITLLVFFKWSKSCPNHNASILNMVREHQVLFAKIMLLGYKSIRTIQIEHLFIWLSFFLSCQVFFCPIQSLLFLEFYKTCRKFSILTHDVKELLTALLTALTFPIIKSFLLIFSLHNRLNLPKGW